MACNCIDTVEENTLNHLKSVNPERDYSNTSLGWGDDGFQNVAFSLGKDGCRKPYFVFKTRYTFEKTNGETSAVKSEKTSIYPTFCPWCGIRYIEEKEGE